MSLSLARISGPERDPVEPEGLLFELFEDHRYEVRSDRADRIEVDGRELDPAPGGWILPIGRIGSPHPLVLRATAGSEEVATRLLRVVPRPEKLSEVDWLAMLDEIEAWMPGLTVGIEEGRLGAVGEEGVAAPLLAEALAPLIPSLVLAVRRLCESPRRQVRILEEEAPLRAVRRADREALRRVVRRPELAAALDPWRSLAPREEPRLFQPRAEEHLDHPANRYVAWLVRRVIASLGRTADALGRLAEGKERAERDSRWASGRAARLERGAEQLQELYRRSFLRELEPSPPSEAALLLVLDDPIYGRVHRLGRRFVSPLFRLDGTSGQAAAIRPTFALYELWSLLAVQRQLERAMPRLVWRSAGLSALLRLGGTGAGAGMEGRSPDGIRVSIQFNPTFPGWLHRGASPRYSLSAERRPDLVIGWDSPARSSWAVLDAKWRVGARSLGEAFASLHIYRDSLRDELRGGRCAGAALLAPSRTEDSAEWFEETFRERHGCGIFALSPGCRGSTELADWLIARLEDPGAG